MSTEGAQSTEGISTEAAVRQAEAIEDLAAAVEEQNRLLETLVDVQAHGGGR